MTDFRVDSKGEGPHTSLSLLARVRKKDQAAWERLVYLYGPLVFAWCLRARLRPADAADVGQEVFLAVARNIDKFQRHREGDTFRGWLYTITRSKICDCLSAGTTVGAGGSDAQRRLAEIAAEESSDPEGPAEAAGAVYRRAVELVRAEFEPRTWEAFWRVTVEDQRPADVAADLGMTTNAVYLAKSHVKHRLREEFDALLDWEGRPDKPPG